MSFETIKNPLKHIFVPLTSLILIPTDSIIKLIAVQKTIILWLKIKSGKMKSNSKANKLLRVGLTDKLASRKELGLN